MTATPPLVGSSRALERVRTTLDRLAPTPVSVHLQGPSGSGKEVAARRLHAGSGRPGPFVVVDCAALAPSLVDAELFGHAQGAFTGAHRDRAGLVEAAHGGTLFLDEVAELPLASQTRLLRVLEQREIRRVGEVTTRSVDLRIVSATWQDLDAAVADGRFRQDLQFRLAAAVVRLPGLAERPEDVTPIARHLLGLEGHPDRPWTDAFEEALRRQPWPGNVRELRNVLQRALVLAGDEPLDVAHLDATRRGLPPLDQAGLDAFVDPELPYATARRALLDAFQHRYVTALLAAHDGNVSRAARAAELDRRTIQRVLRRFRS